MTVVLLPDDVDSFIRLLAGGMTKAGAARASGVPCRTIERRAAADPDLAGRIQGAVVAGRDARRKPHGRASLYAHGCRCGECREGHRAAKSRLVERRRHAPIPATVKHGVYSTYSNWSCRCGPCSVAWGERCRAYQARRKASTET